jgi:thioesterase domain-containing protein
MEQLDYNLLAGHSFGGVLAFEVAHQLQREGISVDMIQLLDSKARDPLWWQKLKVLSLDRARRSLHFRATHSWSRIRTAMASHRVSGVAPTALPTRATAATTPITAAAVAAAGPTAARARSRRGGGNRRREAAAQIRAEIGGV